MIETRGAQYDKKDELFEGKPFTTRKQISLGILSNFSSIGPSMSLGFSAVALPVLGNTFNSSQLTWFASLAPLATIIGCFFSGPFADKYGRRKILLIVNIVCLLGWVTIGTFSYLKNSQFWILALGRILTGLSTGLCSSSATVYMAEVSSAELRGVFTTWPSLTFCLGILVVYSMGYLLKSNLGVMCFITAIFPFIGIIFTTFLIPESPSWLIGQNRMEEAKLRSSKIFDTTPCSPKVTAELQVSPKNQKLKLFIGETKSILENFFRKISHLLQPHCLRPIGLVLIYFMFQQFSGAIVLLFYAIDIVNIAGVTFDAYLTILAIAVVRLFSAILLTFLAKRFGRRPLSIFSGVGMTLCLLPLSLYIYLRQNESISNDNLTYLPLMLLLFFIITSSLGFVPIPFALAAEFFPTNIRGSAAGLTSGIAYFFNFIAVQIYPDMKTYLGRSGTFCFYGVIALIGTIFVTVFLPETHGKTSEEIEKYFRKKDSKVEEDLTNI